MDELMMDAARRAARYTQSVDARALFPSRAALERLHALDQPLQDDPVDPFAAMSITASYHIDSAERDPWDWVPQISRRARGVEIWAAPRSQGRNAVAALVDRSCAHAARFGAGLAAAGYRVLNDVVLNQVLVSCGDDDTTQRVVRRIQEDGTRWCGGATWHGEAVMRISVSCGATTGQDVEQSLDAMLRIAAEEARRSHA